MHAAHALRTQTHRRTRAYNSGTRTGDVACLRAARTGRGTYTLYFLVAVLRVSTRQQTHAPKSFFSSSFVHASDCKLEHIGRLCCDCCSCLFCIRTMRLPAAATNCVRSRLQKRNEDVCGAHFGSRASTKYTREEHRAFCFLGGAYSIWYTVAVGHDQRFRSYTHTFTHTHLLLSSRPRKGPLAVCCSWHACRLICGACPFLAPCACVLVGFMLMCAQRSTTTAAADC